MHVQDLLFTILLQVISPLLVVYHVAQGRAMKTTNSTAIESIDSLDLV